MYIYICICICRMIGNVYVYVDRLDDDTYIRNILLLNRS